jgi:peroxiredoxin
MLRRALVVTAGVVVVALLGGSFLVGQAAEPKEASVGVAPGDGVPEFELFGVDYRYHSLEMYREKEATVVVFTCNHCPVAKGYEDELIRIAEEYQPKGVQFIAVNPNPADMVAADGYPQMIERAKEKQFPYPYVYDETQKTARRYGATVTPHVFVVAPDRTVLYVGAVDNQHKAPHYLADALDDILAGREVAKPTTAQFGCSVKYRPVKKAREPASEGA